MKTVFFFSLLFAVTILMPTKNLAHNNSSNEKPYFNDPIDPDTLFPICEHPKTLKGAIYADPSADPSSRVHDLLRRMTFEEKLRMTGGWNKFMFNGVDRLGIRPVSMADGGQGIRLKTSIIKTKSTTFPSAQALAATWNRDLATRFGCDLGEECRALGVDLLLGPGINLQRLSVGGRNFEYFGEDPFLTRSMAVAYIRALQETGIVAVPKHFIGNDQDFCRHIASSNIDERTLREIYLQPWEGVYVDAQCKGMMTGNNLVNGTPVHMSRELIEGILRKEYGFSGIAMTDWQNSSYYPAWQEKVLVSGETLMMPDNGTLMQYINREIAESPQRAAEIETLVEKMLYHSLLPLFEMGIYDRPSYIPAHNDTFEAHKETVRHIAEEAITLLKNENSILPIPATKRILLAGKSEYFCGNGSGFVTGYDHTDFCTGLKKIYGQNFQYIEHPSEEEIKAADVVLFNLVKDTGEGKDIPFEEPAEQIAELRHIAALHPNVVVLITAANTFPMDWLDDVQGVLWCYYLGQERGNALANIISGRVSPSGKLPFTIEKSFQDSPAPTFNYLGGNPYWRGNNEYRSYWLGLTEQTVDDDFSQWVRPGEILQVPYREGIFIGYRWYDRHNIPVIFPFGYGLSYATFEYSNIRCENRLAEEGMAYVSVEVTNTSSIPAKEVVQLYVTDVQCSVERPQKELKAFEKVSLAGRETKTVTLKLDMRAFSFWDIKTHQWRAEPGEFRISVGGSSTNSPENTILTLSKGMYRDSVRR